MRFSDANTQSHAPPKIAQLNAYSASAIQNKAISRSTMSSMVGLRSNSESEETPKC